MMPSISILKIFLHKNVLFLRFFPSGAKAGGDGFRKMFSTKWHVSFIATNFHLRTLLFHFAVSIYPNHHGGFSSTAANGF